MKKLSPNLLIIAAFVFCAMLGLAGYHLAHAQFAIPASGPPTGIFYPPLDTGSAPQTKTGSLSIGGPSQPLHLELSPAGVAWVTSGGQVTSSIAYDVNLQGLRVTSGGYSSVLGYNWRSSGDSLISNEPIIIGAGSGSVADLESGNFFVPDLAVLNQNRSGGLNFYTNPVGSENYAGIGPAILSAGYFSTSSLLSQYNAPGGLLPNGDLPSFSGIFESAPNGFLDLASDITDSSNLAGASGYGNFRSGAFVRVYTNGNVDILKGAMDGPAFANLVAGQITENPLMDASATLNSVIVVWNDSGHGLIEQSASGNTDITNYVLSTDKNIPPGNTIGTDLVGAGRLPIICPNGYYIDAIKFQANALPDIHCTQMFQSF